MRKALRNKQILSLVTVILFALFIFLQPAPALAGISVTEKGPFKVAVTVTDDNNVALDGVEVILFSHFDNQIVDTSTTDKHGRANLIYKPDRQKFKKSIEDVQLKVIAMTPTLLGTYTFSTSYVNKAIGLSQKQIADIEGPLERDVTLKATKASIDPNIKAKIDSGQLAATATAGGVTPMAGVYLISETPYNSVNTRIAEIHTTDGVQAVLNYSVNSAMDIEVKTNYGSGWSASGSVKITNTDYTSVTWPALTGTSGYGKYALSRFNYVDDYWATYYGTYWHEMRAVKYVGGATWDSSIVYWSDDASPSAITSGTYGNWADFLPGSNYSKTLGNGYTLTGAVSLSPPEGFVSLSATTSYNSQTKTSFTFGNNHSLYYIYDMFTNGVVWVCSHN